jgi:hypothetical protein
MDGAGELGDRGVAEDVEIGGVGMFVEGTGLPRGGQCVPSAFETRQGLAVEHGVTGGVGPAALDAGVDDRERDEGTESEAGQERGEQAAAAGGHQHEADRGEGGGHEPEVREPARPARVEGLVGVGAGGAARIARRHVFDGRLERTDRFRHGRPSYHPRLRRPGLPCYLWPMCRNIKLLFNFDPPATDAEVRAAAVQFVRKVSGFTRPSAANQAAFDLAVDEVARTAQRLIGGLVTNAPSLEARQAIGA